MISTSRVYDIITQALQRCNAVAYGEQLDADLARTAIFQLNILRAAAAKSYANFRYFDTTYTATVGTKSVTLGPGGNFPIRPAKIDTVTAILGAVQVPLPLGTLEDYRALPFTEVIALPSGAYLETGFDTTTLWLFPGLGQGYTLRVTGFSYPPDYESIDDVLADPPEFVDWFIKALSVQLAPGLGDQAERHMGAAAEARARLDRAGFAERLSSGAGGTPFNWLSGLGAR